MTGTAATGSTDDGDGATQDFVDHRDLLFSIAYSMLGTVADTEDVLQETWLAWAGRGTARIDNTRAYLVRIAVNKALARRAAVTRRRETYFGPWLPEPLVAPAGTEPPAGTAEEAEQAESVSMALMVVLETLSPLERAVFVLHEVFGYQHTEIADLLGRSPAAVRQTAHRAREHVHARRPRYRTDAALRRRVTERFAAAVGGGDLHALLDLLAPDVTLWADGGGRAPAAGRLPVHGREHVARTLMAGAARNAATLHVRWARANGDPSAVLFAGDEPFAVLVVEPTADGDHVRDIYFVTNPEKLTRIP
ncbi:RNA polymerase sigma factor SigJ [Kitasatospora sp. DSM 101779]|uniref:RNA polymerase sigma factor SigJ n=1 Tax=Kitasatospora sp. DSM 101779 TaxID=2853165 RepID=UPI0021DB604F|nr:RNA polymerase sigma factor SigJ [Kitasatospora sp. DSM 101779]MCU7825620.1 RNA polymerase sigma factor SigJ [Kitasatospora sp. DSM 101779]